METFSDAGRPGADLGDLDRGRVIAWTRYPPVPAGYYPGLGAAWGLLACAGRLGDVHPALAVAGVMGAVVIIVAVLGSYRRRRGQMPSRHMPRGIRRPLATAVVVMAAMFAALAALAATPVWPAASLLGAALGAAAGPWYERAYRRAADAAERRVGLA